MASDDQDRKMPDQVIELVWKGSTVRIRRWFDTGNVAVWRKHSPSWKVIMKGLAWRYGGRFVTQYEDWYFPGHQAHNVERALRRICARQS